MASSNSSTTIRYVPSFTPVCGHELPCDIQTLHQQYFCCPMKKWDDCEFFQWIDSPLQSTNSRLRQLVATEALLNEKLREKSEECEEWKSRLGEIVKENVVLKANHVGGDTERQISVSRTPRCGHGLKMDILISHEEMDEGRKFFACPVRKYDDCDVIQWIDEPIPRNFCRNHCDHRLVAEKEKYERALECKKLSEFHLLEELKTRNREYEKLKAKYDDLMKLRTDECAEFMNGKLDELKNMLSR